MCISLTLADGIEDFAFLSERAFLLVRPMGAFETYTFHLGDDAYEADDAAGESEGTYPQQVAGSEHGADPEHCANPRHRATYLFPPLSSNYMYWYISMSSNPTPGFRPATEPGISPFASAPPLASASPFPSASPSAAGPDSRSTATDARPSPMLSSSYYPRADDRIHSCCVYTTSIWPVEEESDERAESDEEGPRVDSDEEGSRRNSDEDGSRVDSDSEEGDTTADGADDGQGDADDGPGNANAAGPGAGAGHPPHRHQVHSFVFFVNLKTFLRDLEDMDTIERLKARTAKSRSRQERTRREHGKQQYNGQASLHKDLISQCEEQISEREGQAQPCEELLTPLWEMQARIQKAQAEYQATQIRQFEERVRQREEEARKEEEAERRREEYKEWCRSRGLRPRETKARTWAPARGRGRPWQRAAVAARPFNPTSSCASGAPRGAEVHDSVGGGIQTESSGSKPWTDQKVWKIGSLNELPPPLHLRRAAPQSEEREATRPTAMYRDSIMDEDPVIPLDDGDSPRFSDTLLPEAPWPEEPDNWADYPSLADSSSSTTFSSNTAPWTSDTSTAASSSSTVASYYTAAYDTADGACRSSLFQGITGSILDLERRPSPPLLQRQLPSFMSGSTREPITPSTRSPARTSTSSSVSSREAPLPYFSSGSRGSQSRLQPAHKEQPVVPQYLRSGARIHPWHEWGWVNTRWFRECLSTDWQHASYGLRAIDSVRLQPVKDRKEGWREKGNENHDPASYPALLARGLEVVPPDDEEDPATVLQGLEMPRTERHLRLRDFNTYFVTHPELVGVDLETGLGDGPFSGKGKGKARAAPISWRAPRVVTALSKTPSCGVFCEDIVSSLPYVEVISEETFEVTDVMMDECRVLLLTIQGQRGGQNKLKGIDVLTM